MIKLKKVAGILTAAAVAASLFSGCGEIAGKSNVTKITMWSGNSHSKSIMEEVAKKFNDTVGKEKKIYFDYVIKEGGSLSQAIDVALQNGDAPEILGTGDVYKMIANKQIVALDDLPGGKELIGEFEGKLYLNNNVYYGKTYTVPAVATTMGLIYNKTLFKEAGIVDENGEAKPPETWDELREDAKKLTKPSKKQYGIILPVKWGGWVESDIIAPSMASCGFSGYNPKTGKYDYSNTEYIMNTFLGIKKDASMFPGAEGMDNDSARAQFATGNIGMKFGFSFDAAVLNDQFSAKCDWGVAKWPTVDKNVHYRQRMSSSSVCGLINSSVLENGKAEAVMEVVKYLASKDTTKYLYFGGVEIPFDGEIINECNAEKDKELPRGWSDFADMVKISQRYAPEPNSEMGSNPNISERFVNEVWSGKSTPHELIEDYTKIKNDAVKKYYELHSDESLSDYIIPDWDTQL